MAKRVSVEALAKQEKKLARKRAYLEAKQAHREADEALGEAHLAYMADSTKRDGLEKAAEEWKQKYVLLCDAESALNERD